MSIQDELNQIKSAVYGADVRDAIHDGVEKGYNKASLAESNSLDIKQTYDEILMNWDSDPNKDPEVISARGGLPQLEDRFNETDAQLAQIGNREYFKVFDSMPTAQELQDGQVGLVIGDVIYPVTLYDHAQLDNGFVYRQVGTFANGKEVSDGVFEINTLDTSKITTLEQPAGVASLTKNIVGVYKVSFEAESIEVQPWGESPSSSSVVPIFCVYDGAVGKEVLDVRDHTTYRKVAIMGVRYKNGNFGYQIYYFNGLNEIRYWNGSAWQSDSIVLNTDVNRPLKIEVERKENNGYHIIIKDESDVILEDLHVTTGVRYATSSDRIFIGDHVISSHTGTDTHYFNCNLRIGNVTSEVI